MQKRILVVDDLPNKLAYLTEVTRSARPSCEVIQATCAQDAFRIIRHCGANAFEGGVIDFDLGGGYDGGNVIGELRRHNAYARITLATARDGASFEDEAKPVALAAGANDALSTAQEDFESRVGMVLAA